MECKTCVRQNLYKSISLQGRKRNKAVYYTSPQSFKTMFPYSLAQLETGIEFWLVD